MSTGGVVETDREFVVRPYTEAAVSNREESFVSELEFWRCYHRANVRTQTINVPRFHWYRGESPRFCRALTRELLCTFLELGSWEEFQASTQMVCQSLEFTLDSSDGDLFKRELEDGFGPRTSESDPEGHKIGVALLYVAAYFSGEQHTFFRQWWEDVVLQRSPPTRDSGHNYRSQDFLVSVENEWARSAFEWLFENPATVHAYRLADCELLGIIPPDQQLALAEEAAQQDILAEEGVEVVTEEVALHDADAEEVELEMEFIEEVFRRSPPWRFCG
jgi:hypothetical protein